MSTVTHIILDMDSTLLSMECLDQIVKTALVAKLEPMAVEQAMQHVQEEMDKGMSGAAPLSETIPRRLAIAKKLGAPVTSEHFEIVAAMVESTLTQSIVETLTAEFQSAKNKNFRISIVSGGPQICVDAAARALDKRLESQTSVPLGIEGYGNVLVVRDDGVLDTARSVIADSKIETVRKLIKDGETAIMVGDAATDVAVHDAGLAPYFIAVGIWVQRPILFNRPENKPFYIKVERHEDFAPALRNVIHASQN